MYLEEGAVAGRGASECKGPEAGGYWGVWGPARRLLCGWSGARRDSGRGRDTRGSLR